MHDLTRAQARRIAVQAQLLDAPRPGSLLEVVTHLTMLQVDLTAAVAPSADLVAWSRLGPAFVADELAMLLEHRVLIELAGVIRPAEDIALHRADFADWPGRPPLRPWQVLRRDWVRANDRCRRDILAHLDRHGPALAGELPDTCAVPWRSSGWTNDRNVGQLLEFLAARGEVAVAGRRGRERVWDLAERVYPTDPPVPTEQASLRRAELRLHSLGIVRARRTKRPGTPVDAGDVGEAASIDGVGGSWRVDPAYLERPFTGRTALLSPLDQLVFDRTRMAELFNFDYALEMYKPAGRRRWGYFALPVLHGDRLVGKLDARADHSAGVLRVTALHEDAPFSAATTAQVHAEIEDLARWLHLEPELPR